MLGVIGDYSGTVVKTIGDELATLGVEVRVGMCYGSVGQEADDARPLRFACERRSRA